MSESPHPTPYADVNAVLRDFQANITALLGGHAVGMYLLGSLALGDFDPRTSDIDLLVVTEADIDELTFNALHDMHARFAASGSPWAGRMEAVYAPPYALQPNPPRDHQYPQLERGTDLFRAPLEDGWVFQRHTLREHAVVIAGANPRTLLPPVQRHEIRPAVAAIAGMWGREAANDPSWLAWLRERPNQVFVIFTLCRMLYSLEMGDVVSKPAAARWGQATLGEPYASLIASSLAKQHEGDTITPAEEAGTLAFIDYTVRRSLL